MNQTIIDSQGSRSAVQTRSKQRPVRHWATAYTFLAPALLLFTLFELFSLVYNVYMGFFEWNGFKTPVFVGLENYDYLIHDDLFVNALTHNLIFVLIALLVMTSLAVLLALLLDSGMPGAGIFRGLFFLPVVIPTVVVGLAWTRVYSVQGGLLNQLLGMVGLSGWQQDWLGNPQTALPAVLVVWVWRHLGYGVIMFSAGLLGITEDIKEAAALDGAGPWQTARFVIIPLLRPIIVIVALLYTIFAFKVFTLIFIMTGGGPYNATGVLNIYMYENVFNYYDLGLGSAVANIGIVILIVLAFVRSRMQAAAEY